MRDGRLARATRFTRFRRRSRRPRLAGLALLCALAGACGDGDLVGNIRPDVREGSGRIWEVAAPDLPSAFDVFSGRRLFLGGGDINATQGDVFLQAVAGTGELRLRSIASLLRLESVHAVEIQDLGPVDFGALQEVPDRGYVASEDSTGVGVVPGHVYALSIRRSNLGANFAKLIVDAVGGTPPARFIDFHYVFQLQPTNRGFESRD